MDIPLLSLSDYVSQYANGTIDDAFFTERVNSLYDTTQHKADFEVQFQEHIGRLDQAKVRVLQNVGLNWSLRQIAQNHMFRGSGERESAPFCTFDRKVLVGAVTVLSLLSVVGYYLFKNPSNKSS